MKAHSSVLRDFTVDRRVWLLSGLSVLIGVGAAALAVALLAAIHLFTNIFYYHRVSLVAVRPAGSTEGWLLPFMPIIGGLIVGVMARYGSERIRGHGMPEAIEAILIRGARMDPAIAVLKPLSAAIAIGSGGPFGAEGPIIMTGGAFGSLVAQWFNLTDAERTTLLVAGAAGGMAATFAAPVASILLAVELLLFEWRPRSLLPVVVAAATASVVRDFWLGIGPIFPMAPMPSHFSWLLTPAALGFGMLTGLFAALVSNLMYRFEDLFHRLHVHWMWWPAIGGIGIGVGGYFFPRGLGVGYGNIADLLAGHATWGLVFGLLIAKTFMWTFSLGSGTSGGVLAPLLMIGGGLGALVAAVAHCTTQEQALWALLGMAAMLSGSLGVPLTATVFAVELTHALPAFLPLMLAAAGAHLVTSLIMPRSILTEKLSRRGFHLTREYGVDALELVTVGEAMVATAADAARRASVEAMPDEAAAFAYSDETCREAAERMASTGRDTLPVMDRATQARVGELSMRGLLVGRQRAFDREQMRLRPFGYGRHHHGS